jgi:predicted ester cyclase
MTEEPERLVLRWVEYLRTSEDTILTEIFGADHHDHVSGQRGHEIYRTVQGWLEGTFADLSYDVHGVTTGDGLVMIWLSMKGRHIGNAFPALRDGPEPDGRTVTAPAVHIFRAADGRLSEHWAVRDDLGLLRQLKA